MQTRDPLAKFFSLTGPAAAALRALEQVGRKRCEVQNKLRPIEARIRQTYGGTKRDALEATAAPLRREAAELLVRERALLDEHAAAATQEDRLRDALSKRGLLR